MIGSTRQGKKGIERGVTPTPFAASFCGRKITSAVFRRRGTDAVRSNYSPAKLTQRGERCRGFTMLFAVIVAAIVLAIGMSVLSITLKQFTLSGTARNSEIAFNAAYAGVECVRYWDTSSEGDKFDIGSPSESISCFGISKNTPSSPESGDEQTFTFENWGSPSVCTEVSVFKFFSDSGSVPINVEDVQRTSCPEGVTCTVLQSRGYNQSCNEPFSLSTVEREFTFEY